MDRSYLSSLLASSVVRTPTNVLVSLRYCKENTSLSQLIALHTLYFVKVYTSRYLSQISSWARQKDFLFAATASLREQTQALGRGLYSVRKVRSDLMITVTNLDLLERVLSSIKTVRVWGSDHFVGLVQCEPGKENFRRYRVQVHAPEIPVSRLTQQMNSLAPVREVVRLNEELAGERTESYCFYLEFKCIEDAHALGDELLVDGKKALLMHRGQADRTRPRPYFEMRHTLSNPSTVDVEDLPI